MMYSTPNWTRDGHDWPQCEYSEFITIGELRWHVQRMGTGPILLLLHGTGSATHSWRNLAPLLAQDFTLIAPDLPGHGFTEIARSWRLSLPVMAKAVAELLQTLKIVPALTLGHSAGAAILLWLIFTENLQPQGVVSINGAFFPWRGLPGQLFGPTARFLAANPLTAYFFSWQARERRVIEQLVRSTGSTIDAQGIELYQRLLCYSAHVQAALSMMANWDLQPLVEMIPQLKTRLLLLVGANDQSVAPSEARRIQMLKPDTEVNYLKDLGHLAHEEQPLLIAQLVRAIAQRWGILSHSS